MRLEVINDSKDKIIGRIKTIPISDEFEPEEFNVIVIREKDGKKFYITDQWYKPGVRQVVVSDMVSDFQEL